MQLGRHCSEQCVGIRRLPGDADARPGQGHLRAAEALGRAQRRIGIAAIEQHVHTRLVIAGRDERAEHVDGQVLGIARYRIAAPCVADQPLRAGAVAAREQRLGEREFALGGNRLLALEVGLDRGVLALVVPQRRFDAAAQEGLRRPARIGGDEGAVALDRSAIVIAAQIDPFAELARHGIANRLHQLCGFRTLALADQLDDVFERFGIRLRGRRRRSNGGAGDRLFGSGGDGSVLAGGWLDRGSRARGIRCERLRGGSYGRWGLCGTARDRTRFRQWYLGGRPGLDGQHRYPERQRQTGAQGCPLQGCPLQGCPPRSCGEEQVLHGIPPRRIRQSHAFP